MSTQDVLASVSDAYVEALLDRVLGPNPFTKNVYVAYESAKNATDAIIRMYPDTSKIEEIDPKMLARSDWFSCMFQILSNLSSIRLTESYYRLFCLFGEQAFGSDDKGRVMTSEAYRRIEDRLEKTNKLFRSSFDVCLAHFNTKKAVNVVRAMMIVRAIFEEYLSIDFGSAEMLAGLAAMQVGEKPTIAYNPEKLVFDSFPTRLSVAANEKAKDAIPSNLGFIGIQLASAVLAYRNSLLSKPTGRSVPLLYNASINVAYRKTLATDLGVEMPVATPRRVEKPAAQSVAQPVEQPVEQETTQQASANPIPATRTEELIGRGELSGGAETDAAIERRRINDRFATKITGLTREMTTVILSLVTNKTPSLIEYLSSTEARPVLSAFKEIAITSRAYIPILSGYYRVPEAVARKNRYLASLTKFIDAIEKNLPTESAAKNAFHKASTIAKEMIHAIESTNAEIDAIFARLASDKIKEITALDTPIKTGSEVVPEYEAAIWTGDAFTRNVNAVERLVDASRRAMTKRDILRGIDDIDEYLSKGKGICQEAVKRRLEELQLNYQALISHVDPQLVDFSRKIVEFRLSSYKAFYDMLIETDTYLTKSHRSFLNAPAIRDELYRSIASWSIAAQQPTSLTEKQRTKIDEILKDLFPNEDKAVFKYVGDALSVRRLGYPGLTLPPAAAVAPTEGPVTAERIREDYKMYDDFRAHLAHMLQYSPQLHLVFSLVNIIEKEFDRGIDSKKYFDAASRFIIASAFDLCRRGEALSPYTAAELATKYGYHSVVGGAARGVPTISPAGAPTEATLGEKASDIGIYIRHTICDQRIEDELFVRWMKAICSNLLLSLDRDRASHGVEKVKLPGAERLLIGGAIDDPIGYVGSTQVIPEAALLYRAFPLACKTFEAYFRWNASGAAWTATDEPQLVFELPTASRFYSIYSLISENNLRETISETYIAKLTACVNDLWGQFTSIPDPTKRGVAIIEAFIDEINNALIMQLVSEHNESEAREKVRRDRDQISGVQRTEDDTPSFGQPADAHRVMRKRVLEALKGISMSVFDIMTEVNTSEDTMSTDFKLHIERLQKRLTEVPEKDRFRELVVAIQKPDDTVGDMQGMFMSFVEIVVTPLFLIEGVAENYVYRLSNLYIQIARALYSSRINASYRDQSITPNLLAHSKLWPNWDDVAVTRRARDDLARAGFNMDLGMTMDAINGLVGRAIAARDGIVAGIVDGRAARAGVVATPAYIAARDAYDLALKTEINRRFPNVVMNDVLSRRDVVVAYSSVVFSDIASMRAWYVYGGIPDMARDETHPERLKRILGEMLVRSFDATRLTDPNNPAYGQANGDFDWNGRGAFFLDNQPYASRRAYLHMTPTIYKALMLVIDAGNTKFTTQVVNEARPGRVDCSPFIAFLEDSITDLKAALTTFMRIGKKDYAEKYFQGILDWDIKGVVKDIEEHVNLALGAVHCDYYLLREYLPVAVCAAQNASDRANIVSEDDRLWRVHYSRNLSRIEPTDDENAKRLSRTAINYEEQTKYIIGAPYWWGRIDVNMQDQRRAGLPADQPAGFCSHSYMARLAMRRSIFSPMIKQASRIGPGTGRMPWSEADQRLIEEGWTSQPATSEVSTGVGMNTPAGLLAVDLNATKACRLDRRDTLQGYLMLGQTDYHGGAAVVPIRGVTAAQARSTMFYDEILVDNMVGIQSAMTMATIMPSLYHNSYHATRAETLNRLMVKMESALTLQGDQPCILFDLSKDLSEHHGLARYFHPIEQTFSERTVTFFPETIGTTIQLPVQVGRNTVMHDFIYTDQAHELDLDPDINGTTNHVPLLRDGSVNPRAITPNYKPHTFLYDVSIIGFHNSITTKTPRRIGDLTPSEMSKYLASIPQFIAAYQMLLAEIDADMEIGAKQRVTQASHPTGSFLSFTRAADGSPVFANVDPPEGINEIPSMMREALIGLIECLTKTYRAIREKYGTIVHGEMTKGDFDPYLTAGKFDSTKLATPLAVMAGATMVGMNGPVVMAGFGERGNAHTQTAAALAWATTIRMKDVPGTEVVDMNSIPWTADLIGRLKKMTHAEYDTILQPLVTRMALLFQSMNRMNLSAMALHNPWTCHSASAAIFHAHSIELDVATVHAGIDLLRYGNSDYPRSTRIGVLEGVLPYFADYPVEDSRSQVLFDPGLYAVANSPLGKWVIVPFPITFDRDEVQNHVRSLNFVFTTNPYIVDRNNQPTLRNALWRQTGFVAQVGAYNRFLTSQAGICTPMYNSFTDIVVPYANSLTGDLMAVVLAALREESSYYGKLRGDRKMPLSIPSYGARASDADLKTMASFVENRAGSASSTGASKIKTLINRQLGFKIGEGDFDATYTEMIRFSPPKDRWSESVDPDKRLRAGLFMYLRRNPVSILKSLKLIPFASIYSFSEAFDLYFQLAAVRNAKLHGEDKARSRVPTTIIQPLSLSRRFRDFNSEGRVGWTWVLSTDQFINELTIPYDRREAVPVAVAAHPHPDERAAGGRAIESFYPSTSSIITFYNRHIPYFDHRLNMEFGFCSPSDAMVGAGHSLIAYPIVAMFIRLLDQYGIILKDELAARLREIEYDRPESLAHYKNAIIHILGNQ